METEERPVVPYVEHIGMTRQYWRDIILGVNDGLVSMLLLVAGVVGGGLDADQVLLTGITGAIAGAVSMGAGEYLATKSQDEILTAELNLERTHIANHREIEVAQVREMLTTMGVSSADLDAVVAALTRDDETLLNAMKALEFGVVDSERRSPYRAMSISGVLFLDGSALVGDSVLLRRRDGCWTRLGRCLHRRGTVHRWYGESCGVPVQRTGVRPREPPHRRTRRHIGVVGGPTARLRAQLRGRPQSKAPKMLSPPMRIPMITRTAPSSMRSRSRYRTPTTMRTIPMAQTAGTVAAASTRFAIMVTSSVEWSG